MNPTTFEFNVASSSIFTVILESALNNVFSSSNFSYTLYDASFLTTITTLFSPAAKVILSVPPDT